MGRFLSAVAVALATVESARFKKQGNANAKYIAGIPVLNDNGDSSLVESSEKTWIAMLDKEIGDSGIGKLCDAFGGACSRGHSKGVPFIAVQASESILKQVLSKHGRGVKHVEPSSTMYAVPEISANAQSASWGLERVGIASRRATGLGSHVYVLDTGIRVSHQDFEGRAIPGAESLNGRKVKACEGVEGCAGDAQGHGTHCAGTVGGKDYGVAPAATIYSVKVLGDNGSGSTQAIMLGMDWVATEGLRPAVASMSLGSNSKVESFGGAVDAVFEAGVVVVVAAGNSNMDACGFSPAWVPNAITVGSTDSNDVRSSFSCYGSCVDIWAPGSDITSAAHTSDRGSATFSGTSMACPHVAGAVAALFEEFPAMTSATAMSTLNRFAQENYISDLSNADVNVFLWVGDQSNTQAPPEDTPPTFVPAPCRRRFRC